jgi:hypothetical protein
MQTTLHLLYKTISGSKKKERFETILEPLQALIQIGFLSYYPIGTKLTIQNNILYIQAPTYSQSVTRWYNNDTQEDLFYLFNIFCRFKKFYTDEKIEYNELFTLLIELAKNGINNLIRTYNQTEKTHVLHTLQMYKNMLDGTNNHHIVPPNSPINLITPAESTNSNSNSVSSPRPPTSSSASSVSSTAISDMDDIFIKISELYSDEVFKIIHQTLIAMKNDENNYMYYADGLNMILRPVNIRIKKWIDENIVF